jgi:hypothetical protein
MMDDHTKERKQLTDEEKAEREAEERLKRLPTPERERLIQRRKKFEMPPVKPDSSSAAATQKRRLNSDNNDGVGDAISLSVDDTLDMFDDDQRGGNNRRQRTKGKGIIDMFITRRLTNIL